MTAYDRLSQIIPEDQALANKALAVSMLGITGISSLSLPQFANAVANVQTTANLPLVSALTSAVSPAAANVILSTIGTGTGQNGTVTIYDILGTAAGYVSANALTNSATIINSMPVLGNAGDANSLVGIYTFMEYTVNGTFGDPVAGPIIIIDGPAAGTYANASSAFSGEGGNANANVTGGIGLLSAASSAVANVVSADPTDAATLNSYWEAMINQLILEKQTQAKANLDFTQLTPNDTSSIYGLVFALPDYGQQTQTGGMASFIQSVANLNNLGGQSVVATMREGQTKLTGTGIGTNTAVPDNAIPPIPQANLIPATYPYPLPPTY